ncbi:hypothetical protein A3E49_01805 [Candidatus Saccharibacteria bacterium RIFCSPHIGHO2_12_FULL_49_19]|nr:MAG: hypothetical protein A2708_02120 [Candidatus Saccharibacteria bacterium RIFCSPHIGHO2_01_FULL_49_21]OGL36430.1 MAG: hypothetical protein A3E49_01805 [Candidatus Saccharibacteria bacterium RIFCSPHIGHO2_12_FULL_49_19]OGL37942.1 MAG: hypothetical protein A3B63_01265 [Candidatus Saccharibacteria bacterium RIFCSPLOWO2_01_FULL_49_22]
MRTATRLKKSATTVTAPPNLPKSHSGSVTLLGLVFLAMAVTQLISFNEFEVVLAVGGFGNTSVVATILILAELLAAVGFLRLRISHLLRVLSAISAVAVSGFWFVQNIRLISDGMAGLIPNVGFFGDYLVQSPGWWTTLQTAALVFWVIYSLNLMRSSLSLEEA